MLEILLQAKRCRKCKVIKPLSEFENNKKRKDGKGARCHECENERDRKYRAENKEKQNKRQRRWLAAHPEKKKEYKKKFPWKPSPEVSRRGTLKQYGLTTSDYNRMVEQQDGVCAICGSDNKGKNLNVDHDHKTGRVRGLLCNHCNWGLGHMKDDTGILEKAIGYLSRLFEK
jgi:hypothetical protein